MSASFNDMLNEYLSYPLLKEKLEQMNYLWKAIEHDDGVSGDIIVPFEAGKASSIKRGHGPTEVQHITKFKYTRGSIPFDSIPRVWGSMIFNYEDILNHDGRVKAKSFLGTFLPEQIESFTTKFAEDLNQAALNTPQKDETADAGTVGGVVEVKRIERYELGEHLNFEGGASGWVREIDVNASTVTVYDAKEGGSPVDLTGVAAGVKIFKDGAETAANQMLSLRDALLTETNGGTADLYGTPKLSSPYTQAINIDGSTMTADNVLEKIFDGVVEFRRKAKTAKTEIWMSYKHLGSVMKKLEQDKGPWKMEPGSMKVNQYGFTEINIFGPKTGALKVVAIQELDDDVIYGIDPKAMKLQSVKGIQKVKSPDGNFYTVSRSATSGYDFICDLYYRGTLTVFAPHRCCVWYGINY